MTASPVLSTPPARKKPAPKSVSFGRFFGRLILIILSPVLLLLDALHSGPSHRNTLYAFMLFTTVVMAFTGMAVVVTEASTARLLTVLANPGCADGGDVPQDKTLNAVYRSALRYGIDPRLVLAIIKAESGFRPLEVSSRGAKGLMQIMPATWRRYHPDSQCDGLHGPAGVDHGDDCIFNVDANIDTGVHYLRDLLDHYKGRVDLALEAYNAGVGNVDPGSEPRFEETQNYLQRISAFWADLRREPVAYQIQAVGELRRCLKTLFILCGSLWLILFFWVTRRVLPRGTR